METLYSAALRVSELCNSNWQDIDFNKREIRVIGKGQQGKSLPARAKGA
jgi:integrase/recombinase XerC